MAKYSDTGDWGPDQERRLRKAWAGEPPELDGPVLLADYDPGWPALYEREAARIRGLLGDRVLLLEHVGSTSVPGLAAKPVIDILLVVADPAEEASYVPALERAGYRVVIREPGWHEHRALKGPDTDVNLHVHPPGSPEIERHLRFRDRLRASEADRELYEQAKRELAGKRWTYVQQYSDAKTGVIEAILARSQGAADGEWTVERHLFGKPAEVIALYRRFIELAEACGPFTYAVSKTAITLKGRRRGFAGAVLGKNALRGYFDLPRRVDDARISRSTPYTRRLFVHHFRVNALGQLDEQFAGWLAEAYQVGAGAHLGRPASAEDRA